MELQKAQQIAGQIVLELSVYCHRIAIAGSIRRLKPDVKDIEIVCIPKQRQVKDLFEKVTGSVPVPEFCQQVNRWEKIKGEPTGKYTQRLLPEGINLDLFIATHDNWGLILAIRTGSAEYSHKILATGWVKKGYECKDGYLRSRGSIIPVREEEELFRIIGLPYADPNTRNL